MAVVRIDLEVNNKGEVALKNVAGGLDTVGGKATSVQKLFNSMFEGIGIGAGINIFETLKRGAASAVTFLGDASKAAIAYGGQLMDMKARTGLAAEAQQTLAHAGKLVGVEFQAIAAGLNVMQKALLDAPEKFGRIGLSAAALRALKPEEQFLAIGERIAAIPDPAARAAAAIEMFGRSGATLLPLLTSNIREAQKQAEELGLVMSTKTAAAADALGDAIDTLSAAWEGLKRNIVAVIIENKTVHDVVAGVTNILGGLSKEASKSKDGLGELVSKGVLGLVDALLLLTKTMNDVLDVIGTWQLWWLKLRLWITDVAVAAEDMALSWDRAKATMLRVWEALKAGPFAGPMILRQPIVVDEPDSLKKKREQLLSLQQSIDGLLKGSAARGNALADVAGQIAALRAELEKTVGATADVAEGARKGGDGLQYLGKNAEAARTFLINYGSNWAPEGGIRRQKFEDILQNIPGRPRGRDIGAMLLGPIGAAVESIKPYEAAVARASAATQQWQGILQSVTSAVTALGIGAESTFGKIVVGIVAAATAGAQAKQAFANIRLIQAQRAERGESGIGMEGIGQAAAIGAAGLGVVMNIWKTSADLGKKQAALAGAAQGAAFGQQFGPYGAAAGAIIGGLIGIFRGGQLSKIAKEAGQELGTTISNETAKAIRATSKELGVSIKEASLLNLDKAMADSKKQAREFAPQVLQLLSVMKAGGPGAAEAMEQVSHAFNKIAKEAKDAGRVGDAALVGILKAARKQGAGAYTEEMKAFTGEKLDASAKELEKWIAAFAKLPQDLGRFGAQGAEFFMANFAAISGDRGKFAAVEALATSFDALRERLAEAGSESAIALLAPFERLRNYMGDETLGPLLQMSDALRGMMVNLADAGYLNVDTFRTMQQSGADLFDAFIEKGMAMPDALEAVVPSIQAAISAAEQFGIPLDADMQRLRELAEQNGYTFRTGPMERMVDILTAIAVKLGAELPASVERAGAVFETFGSSASQTFGDTAAEAQTMVGDITTTWRAGALEMVLTTEGMGREFGQEITAMADAAATVFGYMTDDLEGSVSAWPEIAGQARDKVLDVFEGLPSGISIPIDFPIAEPDRSRFPGGERKGGHDEGFSAQSGFYSPSMPRGPLPGGGTSLVVHPGERVAVTPASENRRGGRQEIHVSMPITVQVLDSADPRKTGTEVVTAIRDQYGPLVTALREAVLGVR